MKKLRKILLLCGLILASFAVLASCDKEKAITTDHADVKIVFLGDSIAEGVLGPAPVIEREDYAYASVVGQINGFTYRNRSVSGHMTGQMLNFISAEGDENAYTLISHIKTANIISVSILGNDLLQTRFSKYANAAIVGDFTEVDELLAESYEHIEGIVARLKALNPNAPLIFQTVYNPAHKETTLIGEDIRSTMYEHGLTDDDVYYVAGLMINRLNNVLRTYAANHPGDIVILDVNDKFDQFYRSDKKMLRRLIFGDDIHPSNEGHATIAALLQEALETMGLADHAEALANYKILCENRLKRLYTGTDVNVKATVKAIEKATTYTEVNMAYFNATTDVVPSYRHEATEVEVNENYDVYTLESVEVIGRDVSVAFDERNSFVALERNGNRYEVRFDLTDLVISLVNGFTTAGMDADMLIWVEKYLHAMLPTESLTDVVSAFERLKTDFGIEVHGIDPEDPKTKELIESVQNDMVVPKKTRVPNDVYFTVSGTYANTKIASVTRDKPFDAAYLGDHTKLGEPYLILTYFEENGVKKVLIHNDVLSLNLVAAMLPAESAE